jgi:hypothetical protein
MNSFKLKMVKKARKVVFSTTSLEVKRVAKGNKGKKVVKGRKAVKATIAADKAMNAAIATKNVETAAGKKEPLALHLFCLKGMKLTIAVEAVKREVKGKKAVMMMTMTVVKGKRGVNVVEGMCAFFPKALTLVETKMAKKGAKAKKGVMMTMMTRKGVKAVLSSLLPDQSNASRT